jgi:hypothetical protein
MLAMFVPESIPVRRRYFMGRISLGLLFFVAYIYVFGQSGKNPEPKVPALYIQAPEALYPALVEETRRIVANHPVKNAGWGITIKKENADYIVSISLDSSHVTYAVFETKDGMLLSGGRDARGTQTGWSEVLRKVVDAAGEHWNAKANASVEPAYSLPIASIPITESGGTMAIVYLYRSDGRIYSPFNAGTIYCDGQAIVKLNNRRFIGLRVTAGRRRIAVDTLTNVLEMDLQPSKRYFVRCRSTPITPTTAYLKPIVQEPGEAILEMKRLKSEGEKNIADMSVVVRKLP